MIATALLVACSCAPLVSIIGMAVVVTYDPYRGRFLMFAVALASASWGWLLRWRSVTWGVTGLAIVSAVMSVAMSLGKPSGLVLFEHDPGLASRASIWAGSRVDQQGRLRPGDDEIDVIRFVQSSVPEDASIALASRENDYLSPYFGEKLSRHATFVDADGVVPTGASWLLRAPRTRVNPCPGDWRDAFVVGNWRVLRRVSEQGC